MKKKPKPISRQKKQDKSLSKTIRSIKKVNKRKPVTAMFWQSTLDAVTDAVCFLDVDQRILHCNRTMTEIFGLTPKEIIGKHCWEIVHGTTKPISKCPASRAKKSLARENGEIRKGDRWFNIIADPILDKKGKIKGVVHTLQDITEHKRTAQALQESENKYRKLVENVSEVIFTVDIKGCINYISPAMEHLTGYSTKEVIGTNITKHIIPEDLPDVLASINRILSSGQNEAVEYRIKIKNGEIRNVVSSSNIILKNGQPAGLTGVITDITQRKLAEYALKEAELKFRTIFDSASDGILLADASNKIFTSANIIICAMLGYTKEELLKLRVSDIHPQESLPYVIDQFEKLARKETAIAHDIPVMRKDKTVFFADVNSSSIILDGKECLLGMFRDVTERKKMEEDLKESDTIFKKLSANVPGIIYQFMMKPDGTLSIPFSTGALKELYGISPEDVINDFSPIANVIYHEDIERFINSIKHSAENMSQWQCEYRIQIPGKPLRWLFGTSTPEKLPDGSILWHGFNTDITERKQAQEQLQQKNEMLARTEQISNIGSWEWDIDDDRVRWSEELFHIFQRNPDEGAPSFAEHPDIYVAEDLQRLQQAVERCVADGTPYELELRGIRTDGQIRHCIASGLAHTDSTGKIYQLYGSLQDITERKLTEEALRKKDLMFRILFESSPVGVFLVMDRTFVQVNQSLCNITGYPQEELIGQSVRIVYTDDEEYKRAGSILYEQVMKKGIGTVEALCKRKNGEIFYGLLFLSQIDPQDSSLGYEGIMVDITERKQADEKLNFEEQRFRSLTESSSDIILLLNSEGVVTYINPAVEKVLGYKPEERMGKNTLEFVHPDDLQSMIDKFNILANSTNYSVLYTETRLRHKDGSWRIFETTGNNLLKDNIVEAIIIRQHDITNRKKAEEELLLIKKAVEGSSDAIGISDPQGYHFYQNKAFSDLFGYSTPEELKAAGGGPATFANKDNASEVFDSIMSGRSWQGEVEIMSKNGRIFPVQIRADAIKDESGNIIGLIGIHTDITERKQAEAEISVLSNALKLALDPILILDLEGKVINANEAAKKLFETEDLGVSALDYVAPEDKERVTATMQALLMGNSVNAAEFTIITKSERRVFIEATGNLIVDENGKATGIVVVERDITDRKRMEESLLQEQQFSKSVLDNLPEIFYLFTYPENRLKLGNKQVEMLLGFNTEETIGRHVTEWIVPEYRDAVLKAIDEVMEKGKNSIETPLLTKDGHQIPFFLTGAKFVVDDQSYFMGIGMDLTERKKAEEALLDSETKLKAVIQGSPVPQFVIDQNHKIVYWNKALEEISGIKSTDVLGTNKHWQAFYSTERPCLADLLVDEKINLIPELYEVKFSVSNYSEGAYAGEDFFPVMGKWLFFGAATIRDSRDNIIAAIETLEDITERKNAEKELEKYREHLEELVRERTIKLEASNKELEAFSYSASHDLRAPLRSIEGFSQALLEDYRDTLDIQGKDYLTRIKTATRRMADLIEDMMQLSRITRMEMNIEKVNLTLITRSVMSELQKSQPQRHVEISIADSLEDTADLRLMRIVLDNLLSNAWKFTERQAKAKIEFGLWKTEGSVKTYFIRDNGAGFDMAYSDKLFAPFQRLHADDEFPGTGIGLATVRRIINRHGGKVWAEGQIGEGATFYFSINEK